MFEIHSRLAADSFDLGRLPLSHLRLMNDRRYSWLILVPEQPDISEIFELDSAQRAQLLEEIVVVSRFVSDSFPVDKINVAALGNVVPQLHVHIIGRRHDDFAWPQPVWGIGSAVPYDLADVGSIRALARRLPELKPRP
jgi:diadenosine tetraphosphate (Ap4A) HIT family hydrolase